MLWLALELHHHCRDLHTVIRKRTSFRSHNFTSFFRAISALEFQPININTNYCCRSCWQQRWECLLFAKEHLSTTRRLLLDPFRPIQAFLCPSSRSTSISTLMAHIHLGMTAAKRSHAVIIVLIPTPHALQCQSFGLTTS